MANLIKADNSITLVVWDDRGVSISQIRELIRGPNQPIEDVTVEPIKAGERVLMVNEDGRRLKLPHNHAASVLAGIEVVGDVVMLGPSEIGNWWTTFDEVRNDLRTLRHL